MATKLVNATKLDAALTATANAIRQKTGGSSSMSFDLTGNTGFSSEVEEITPNLQQKNPHPRLFRPLYRHG